jgi:phospholipid transport system substrate-binding protein
MEVCMKPTLLLTLALVCTPAAAARQADARGPDQTVKETIANVMEAIRNEPAAAAGDPDRIDAIVGRQFLPSTDFMLTTQYAVGSAWNGATPAQRAALFREFQTLLARTYALQLTQLQGQDTQFRYGAPVRPAAGAVDAVVKTTVVTGGDATPIAYRLHKGDAGWKIYDIDMGGAWMIGVYRQQFAAQLAAGGVDGLIRYLAAHNARP